jgi:hypothetical protein
MIKTSRTESSRQEWSDVHTNDKLSKNMQDSPPLAIDSNTLSGDMQGRTHGVENELEVDKCLVQHRRVSNLMVVVVVVVVMVVVVVVVVCVCVCVCVIV